MFGRQESSIGIATSCGLDGLDSIPGAARFSLHRVQTGSWAHATFHPMGTGDVFPEDKAARASN
jgi:hypothetical protein